MTELVFDVPDGDTPGYLKRLIEAAKFRKKLEGYDDPEEYFGKLIEFLLPHIISPKDRNEAKDALLNCSKNQYLQLLNIAYGGVNTNPTLPEASETS